MAHKKTTTFKGSKTARISETQSVTDVKQRRRDEIIETFKRDVQKRGVLPVTNDKLDLRNAISEAIKHDAQTGKFSTVKETKQRRRDIIVNTIMRHARKTS